MKRSEHTCEFYQMILNLDKPWVVVDVELSQAPKTVRVRIECQRSWAWSQEAKGGKGHRHGGEVREWRHLDTCGYETILECKVPRIKWPDGSTETLEVPWAERFTRITREYEAYVIKVLLAARSIRSASELLGLSPSTVDGVMERAVVRGLARREETPIEYLGIDEKAFRRGHRYASVLTDIEGGRVWDLREGRKTEDALMLLNSLSLNQKAAVKAVGMDMWPGFMTAAQLSLPGAEIVHDRFHVSKYLGEAVDAVRRSENRRLKQQGNDALTGSKYAWLRGRPDGRTRAGRAFAELRAQVEEVAQAWGLKELFVEFWAYQRPSAAREFFDNWLIAVRESGLEPIKKVAAMLERHWSGLVSYFRHRITNASSEGMNSAIQTIRANARGLPDFQHFRTRVLFYLGKLDLSPA